VFECEWGAGIRSEAGLSERSAVSLSFGMGEAAKFEVCFKQLLLTGGVWLA